ncbi:MAG: hypothetical protein JWM30_1568 [Burkholderia sp.]|nr:hypothetical protein [Burkholderia sp.]
MKKRFFQAFSCLTLISLLSACSGGDERDQTSTSQQAAVLPRPTPSLSGGVEIGGAVPLTSLRTTAATVKSNNSQATASLLAQTVVTKAADNPLAPISKVDPRQVLGADRALANPYQPGDISDLKLVSLPDGTRTRMPTGKWSKGFFYQSPRNLDAYFQGTGNANDPRNNGSDTNQFNIFAFPNKLSLDDRIGMLSISFPTRRYIAYGTDPNASVYDLTNPLKADTLLYHIAPNSAQDIRLSYVQPAIGRLPRGIDSFDELTVTTSWKSPAGDQSMQVIAAEGSPYATVHYTGLRPVIQVGQGGQARTPKDNVGLPIPGASPDYTQQQSDNAIAAVAVGEEKAQSFIENNTIRTTPSLTGTKFRILYQIPDRARAQPGTNDGKEVTPPLTLKELVIYTSVPITLEWDTPSRSYVSRNTFDGVIRTAFVDDVDFAAWAPKIADVSDIASFKARRAILDKYAATYPTSSEIFLDYNQTTALVRYVWKMSCMDGQTPQGNDLLMMGFNATHIPSLQSANKVDGLTYRSNMGSMSAIAGSEWKQQLDIPKIMQNGATGEELWMGSGQIKLTDVPRIRQSLIADTALLTDNFLASCNADSYICGKYLHNVSRLALIADNLGEFTIRNKLTGYLKNSLTLWLDGVKPDGGKVDPATDKANDMLIYDTTNGGVITALGLQDYDKDYHNRAYVDHMFHYGYYIYAASVVAALDPDPDPTWLKLNKEKVNLLVRDIANPSLDDPYFPIVRTFDWFRMQNIADTGPDANGGNTESSSESVNSNYALATWGAVTKNDEFQAVAAIMTAAEIRTSKAFYQITPDTEYLKAMDFPVVDVTVNLPKTRIEVRKIAPGNEPVMNILRSNIVETNTFFGPLLANRVGINLLPISPISEYVISTDWAKVHYDTLRALEDTNTQQFSSIINTPPNQSADCFLAGWDPKAPHLQPDGSPDLPNPGAVCAGRLRVLYSWRQLPVAASGIVRPAEAYNRYVAYMNGLQQQQDVYRLNTRSSVYPDSSRNENGVVADVLKDNSTPSTDTNTLWWLSARKPN